MILNNMFQNQENTRVVGINDRRFCVHEDMRTNRKNIIYKSKQFQKIMDNFIKSNSDLVFYEIDKKILELFEMYENKLTDVKIEIVGYY